MSRSKNFISLAEHNPELIVEWHPTKNGDLTPNDISYGSAKNVWWLGKCGHEWEQNPNHRSRGRGCPTCAQLSRGVSRSKNWIDKYGSLADNNPELAKQWHPTKNAPLTPNDVSVSNGNKAWWLCEKGHEWEAVISSRNQGVGCPICSGHKLIVGENDLATVRPDIAKQWHPTKNGTLRPSDVTIGNGKSVYWICDNEHVWKAKIANRTNSKHPTNCPYCAGKKVLAGFNDLATVRPELVKEWHPTRNGDLTPTNVVAGSNEKVWWLCEKGHEWENTVYHRTSGEQCPYCFGQSKTSFPEQAIFYYFSKVTTAYNRFKLDGKTEIDVYLPEIKIGIEYDGVYFHQGIKAKEREERKNARLEQLGIQLIRVKETKDIFAAVEKEDLLYIKVGYSDSELTNMINKLLVSVGKRINREFDICLDIKKDRTNIYEQYQLQEKENSLLSENPELASQWNYERNENKRPEHYYPNSNCKVYWICPLGHEWEATIQSRNKGAGCQECYNLRRGKKNTK